MKRVKGSRHGHRRELERTEAPFSQHRKLPELLELATEKLDSHLRLTFEFQSRGVPTSRRLRANSKHLTAARSYETADIAKETTYARKMCIILGAWRTTRPLWTLTDFAVLFYRTRVLHKLRNTVEHLRFRNEFASPNSVKLKDAFKKN